MAAEINNSFGQLRHTNKNIETLNEGLTIIAEKVQNLQDRVISGDAISGAEFQQLATRIDEMLAQVPSLREEVVLNSIGLKKEESLSPVATVPKNKITVSKHAQKDISALQLHLKEKYDQFVVELATIRRDIDISPSWSVEKINMLELGIKGGYTVRLNHGYRVLFEFDEKEGVSIHRISKSLTHNN